MGLLCVSMRRMRGIGAVALAAVFAFLLSGCVPQSQSMKPKQPSPSSSPIFASDDEALAAATKAYAAYLAMSDQIAQDGGEGSERLDSLVTAKWLQTEVAAFERFSHSGNHQIGSTTFRLAKIQQVGRMPGGVTTVSAYVCTDFSKVKILNASGEDVTPPSRPSRVAIEAEFETKSSKNEALLLSRNEPWSGPGVC
jgi:hypothetical protein